MGKGGIAVERTQVPGSPDMKIFTIKQINRYIKMRMDADDILQNVWIRGEISNFKHHSSGHMYFTLKDEESRLRCVMFASANQRLAFMPREGTRVIARGSITVYERDGAYQYYVAEMQPDGIGNLYLAFEQLKQKLAKEGLFAEERKRPIPRFPRAVGVITSPTGAAVRDILTTLQRRSPATPVIVYPVAVQGVHAVPTIVKAIETMNRLQEVDVLIVGRGGGSLEELWAFNEEPVARAIAASRIPVISAVGHETDFTIADFVSDLRAATPTAAAELSVPHHLELKQQLAYQEQRLYRSLRTLLQSKQETLERLRRSPYFLHPRRYMLESAERLDRLTQQLQYTLTTYTGRIRERRLQLDHRLARHNPLERIGYMRKDLQGIEQQLVRAVQNRSRLSQQRFAALIKQLDALSPLKVMERGYSVVYDEQEQTVLNSITQVQPGDIVKIRMIDGRLDCHVWAMKGEEHE
ncbi:exodeoxyribonuclease 7 large subunit [Insulibacter thermoxylanivorax]|uniref:Exodeoxyribonuclease 7 large subunit n=2 Tax=Insulibacter thermoxylanivorax TaxID=2749268 RepID=A0A916VE24_9BACL|nr:exodeoxyribonuclease 7 large subunit [Insulibacter thermoxylanivorax]